MGIQISEIYLIFIRIFFSLFYSFRRSEGNPLDLNNLPQEYSERWREGKQRLEESSSPTTASTDTIGIKNNKRSGGKDEPGKVYQCRFCSLKFCKSQALGGHMNRHRQERETETLNRARQLVFGTESLATAPGSFVGFGGAHSMSSSRYYNRDQCLNLRPVYPRIPLASPSSMPPQLPPPPLQPFLYTSNSQHLPNPPPPPPMNTDYLVGHIFTANSHCPPSNLNHQTELNYTCVGAIGDANQGNRRDGIDGEISDMLYQSRSGTS
ncbi:Zinc finger protein STAMENLESS 1 [Acorus gramineus]|uniref:Zinc finger protein STAMENLESS 1 n=1 Tax=Acorus gramineus TaxID=55184 RepID=A0AAV9BUN4_ACOGR|nr:Zinc finger protein STAMENLESS 1 [Acorus gramineus]